MSKQWFGEWGGVFYLLRDRDENFKKGDSFFERAGRYGPIVWDGKETLNYHCKKIICTFKHKQR